MDDQDFFWAGCINCDGTWKSSEAFEASGHGLFRPCPLRAKPARPRGSLGRKRHLPASNQSTRWVGAVLQEQDRSIVTRCGQVHVRMFLRDYAPDLVVGDVEAATCKKCLYSFAAEVAGPETDRIRDLGILGRRLGLFESWSKRIVDGPPLSPHDIRVFRHLDRLLRRKALQTSA